MKEGFSANIADNDCKMKSCIIVETYQPTITGGNTRDELKVPPPR
jgi:hypothetical protein